MPIDTDQFRVLASQRETTTLDFKQSFYENSPKGNGELAKDIIAMANLLDADSAPAHILFGVREESDGAANIVGFTHEQWMTDGNLQQKVRGQLNRPPQFSFTILEVDGFTVAAIEILPGGRPFYALKDNGNLKKNYAYIRVGSTTDLASPDQIVGWVERDGNLKHRRLEAEKLEAEQTLRGRLTTAGGSMSQGVRRCTLEIHNDGTAVFLPHRVTCVWHVDEDAVFRWLSERHVRLLKPIAPYVDESKTIPAAAVRPGTPSRWKVVYKQDELMTFLDGSMRNRLQGVVLDKNALRVFILDTAYCNVTVECENVGGTRKLALVAQFGWNVSRGAFPDPDTGSHAG